MPAMHRTPPLTIIQGECPDSTGFVPVLISRMHDDPGLFSPRLTSNRSLQPIGKIKDNSCTATLAYEQLFP